MPAPSGVRRSVTHLQHATAAQATLDLLRLVVAQRDDHVVVGVHEGRHRGLAFRRAREARQATGCTTAQHAQGCTIVGGRGIALRSTDLHAGADVIQRQRDHRDLRFQRAGQGAQAGAQEARQASRHLARGIVVDDDGRLHQVIGRHALALVLLGTGAEFTRVALLVGDRRQARLGAAVADGGDHEAVGLLHGQTQQRLDGRDLGGRAEGIVPVLVTAVVHGDGSQRRIATLQRRVGIDAGAAGCAAACIAGAVALGDVATAQLGTAGQHGHRSQRQRALQKFLRNHRENPFVRSQTERRSRHGRDQ